MRTKLSRYRVMLRVIGVLAVLCLGVGYFLLPSRAKTRDLRDLPLPKPYPRDEQKVHRTFLNLFDMASVPGKTVVLARVASIAKEQEQLLRRLKKEHPNFDLEATPIPNDYGGRFVVLETLYGPPVGHWLDIDNTPDELSKGTFANISITTRYIRLGEYWIVVCDSSTRKIERMPLGTMPLSGPDDPLLLAYRHFLTWQTMPDRAQAFREMRATILDNTKSITVRVSALSSLCFWADKAFPTHPSVALNSRKARSHTVTELLATPNLSKELKEFAIGSILSNPSLLIASDPDEILQLHYLLNTLANGTDEMAVLAADKLYFYLNGSGDDSKSQTAYYFPEILQALEQREVSDRARRPDGRSPITRTLLNLGLMGRRHLEDIKTYKVVVRSVPPLGDTPLALKIRAATAP